MSLLKIKTIPRQLFYHDPVSQCWFELNVSNTCCSCQLGARSKLTICNEHVYLVSPATETKLAAVWHSNNNSGNTRFWLTQFALKNHLHEMSNVQHEDFPLDFGSCSRRLMFSAQISLSCCTPCDELQESKYCSWTVRNWTQCCIHSAKENYSVWVTNTITHSENKKMVQFSFVWHVLLK